MENLFRVWGKQDVSSFFVMQLLPLSVWTPLVPPPSERGNFSFQATWGPPAVAGAKWLCQHLGNFERLRSWGLEEILMTSWWFQSLWKIYARPSNCGSWATPKVKGVKKYQKISKSCHLRKIEHRMYLWCIPLLLSIDHCQYIPSPERWIRIYKFSSFPTQRLTEKATN